MKEFVILTRFYEQKLLVEGSGVPKPILKYKKFLQVKYHLLRLSRTERAANLYNIYSQSYETKHSYLK